MEDDKLTLAEQTVQDLIGALKGMVFMFETVGKKIDWSKLFLGADEVRLMNEASLAAARAIAKAEEKDSGAN